MQAEEVEDAEAMAEEGLLSAGKGPKPTAAGDAAGLPHCLYVALHHRCTSHKSTSTPHTLHVSCHFDTIHSSCIANAWLV